MTESRSSPLFCSSDISASSSSGSIYWKLSSFSEPPHLPQQKQQQQKQQQHVKIIPNAMSVWTEKIKQHSYNTRHHVCWMKSITCFLLILGCWFQKHCLFWACHTFLQNKMHLKAFQNTCHKNTIPIFLWTCLQLLVQFSAIFTRMNDSEDILCLILISRFKLMASDRSKCKH